jgi:hypothetical protein
MFYRDGLGKELRFGDIVRGFVITSISLTKTHWGTPNPPFDINVSMPQYCAILTPCCSIEDKNITVTPLIPLRPSFFENQYLVEDMTRINRVMTPQQSVATQIWSRLPLEEQQRRISEGVTFAYANLFVYAEHEILPKYKLPKKRNGDNQENNTGYYMIDFKNVIRINCERILSPSDSPAECRVLELTVESREELRIKLGWYFSRPPKEDQILLHSV